ncbi:hypothetical protein FGLOB1_4122 [Fusarium globosum]|uniref:Uncharacterized protein n=1 Tax=Fusarium globosum TaxID=78864 RepID=A0A8H5YJ06_9HYPO|nr:hypothetical protein FGLOB1_4122 [Fusarium globosum]
MSSKDSGNSPTTSSGSTQSDSTPPNDQPAPISINGDDTSPIESSDGNFNTDEFTPIEVKPDDKEESS